MWNHLTFAQKETLARSIRNNKKIDWDTGEGIVWTILTEEELETITEIDLDLNDIQ